MTDNQHTTATTTRPVYLPSLSDMDHILAEIRDDRLRPLKPGAIPTVIEPSGMCADCRRFRDGMCRFLRFTKYRKLGENWQWMTLDCGGEHFKEGNGRNDNR